MSCKHSVPLSLFLLLMLLYSAVGNAGNKPVKQQIKGYVLSGIKPIANAEVLLYRASKKHRAVRSRLLAKTTGSATGYFSITYKSHPKSEEILYLIAQGNHKGTEHSPVKLVAVLDGPNAVNNIIINERTTVAAAYAMAQFTYGNNSIGGKNPGLKNAASTVQNLANISNGNVADILNDPPNGLMTSALPTFNSLANMLAACVQDSINCSSLFTAAVRSNGSASEDTWQAIVNIAQNPWSHVAELFAVSKLSSTYQPALDPDFELENWTLALRYNGDGLLGQQMDGPGNIAFDKDGNAWINNNFEFSLEQVPPPNPPLCGSTKVFKLTPTGGDAPGAPYGGVDGSGENAGGLYGAGFGIAVDSDNNAWVSNFGFKSPDCEELPSVLAISVSKFSADGMTLSPDGDPTITVTGSPPYDGAAGGFGYDGSGNMSQPQGIQSDKNGNIWVANCVNSSVTRFPQGDPDRVENYAFPASEFDKAFDVAIDQNGHAWVTGNGTNNLVELDKKGRKIGDFITGNGINRPMGVAADSQGNLWVANAAVSNPPCPAILNEEAIGDDGSLNKNAAVTLIRHHGKNRQVTTFGKGDGTRDGLRWPWGIAVDGNDNIWVANFAGKRVMQLCGVKQHNCPPGIHTGDPISPIPLSVDADSGPGYANDALKRVTGIQIDPSGNVWAVNNYEENGLTTGQSNPGGHEVVVFIGLAAPVKTPLLGPVQRP